MNIKITEKYISPYYSNAEEKEYRLADNEEADASSYWEELPNGKEVIHIVLSCDHVDYQWETTEVDTMRNGEHDTYEVPIAICSNWECGKVLDITPEEPDYDNE